ILREEPKPVRTVRSEIPSELARLIARCLRKDPARRFQHMADLKVALEELKEESDSGVLMAPGSLSAAHPAARAGVPWLWVAATAVVVGGIGLLTWRLTLPKEPAEETAFLPVPLTSYAGVEGNPSFSPDGNQVVFS